MQARKFPDAAHVYGRSKQEAQPSIREALLLPPEPLEAERTRVAAKQPAAPEPVILSAPPAEQENTARAMLEGVLRAIPRKNRDY